MSAPIPTPQRQYELGQLVLNSVGRRGDVIILKTNDEVTEDEIDYLRERLKLTTGFWFAILVIDADADAMSVNIDSIPYQNAPDAPELDIPEDEPVIIE